MRYTFSSTALVDCGGTLKPAAEIAAGDTMLTFDFGTQDWAMSTVESIEFDVEEGAEEVTNVIKINTFPSNIHPEALVPVKDAADNILYGYFTETAPTGTSVDPAQLVKVVEGLHKVFNGGEWVLVEEITYVLVESRLVKITLADHHALMADNVLTSTL